MAHEGQELEGTGVVLRFVRISDELLEIEARYSGEGSLPPAHLHPHLNEHFEVLEGAVRTVIEGQPRRYAAGEEFDVPAGTVHQMGGDGPARVKWEVRPALRFAQFFEELYGGAAARDPEFFARYGDEFRLAEQPRS